MKREPAERPSVRFDTVEPMRWAKEARAVYDVVREMNRWLARRRRRRQFIAGGVAALMICVAMWRIQPFSRETNSERTPADVVVTLPERRVLPDGSVVMLKTGAEIEVRFEAARRHVALRRGEAHFDVVKNERQPFVVEVGDVGVRAVGTAFCVSRSEKVVEILVTEGRVAVEESGRVAAPQPTAYAGAGELAMVALEGDGVRAAPSITSVTPAAIADRLAWQVAHLEFSGAPLAKVVELLNRHGSTRLILLDRGLDGVRISGALRADNADTLLRLLAEDYGIRAHEGPGGEIGLSKVK